MTEQENEFAPGWRPTPGDEVEGKVIGIDAKERKKPKPGDTHYPILTIESADGSQVAVHAFHTVLERELKNHFNASEIVGSQVKIRYEGKRTTKDGENTYELYKVYGGTRRPSTVAAALNWGDDAPEAPPTAWNPSAPVPPTPDSSGGATAEDFSPLPPQPSRQQQAAESYGDKAPF